MRSPWTARLAAFALLVPLAACARRSETKPGEKERPVRYPVEVFAVDEAGAPVAARMHVRNQKGDRVMPKGFPGYHDHFVFDGKARLELAAGEYRFELERGPEFTPVQGSFHAGPKPAPLRVRLVRFDHLAKEGFYPGDLHVHRPRRDLELLMRADDLYVVPLVSWNNQKLEKKEDGPVRFDGNRFVDATAGEDERFGGALLFFRLQAPLALPKNLREKGKIVHREGAETEELPPALEFARQAKRDPHAHVHIEKPFWWDVPVWLASGLASSVELAHNHMSRSAPRNHEAWGRKCDRKQYGETPLANGYCTQDIYYRILDTGQRLVPSAGSGSGVLPNPVGFNRVYVHVEGPLSYEKWWEGLEAGRSFVTNGPLLRVSARAEKSEAVRGELPGHVFVGKASGRVGISLDVRIRSTLPILNVELVRDGRVVETAKYDASSGVATFSPLVFEKSGWFLVRAICDRKDAFRFASSAPYWVEIPPDTRRVSRAAVMFFRDWVKERRSNLEKKGDPARLAPALREQRQAERYFAELFARANAD